MAKPASLKTKVSTKGQVILPKTIRDRRGWTAGSELIVEDKPEGVLLRAASKTGATRFEDVAGSLGPVERVVSIEEMHQGLLDEAARRYRKAVDDRN
jgi:AbrB family looped-hinge helix DNA binding protein